MSIALSRPVIAQAIVDVAREEQADAVAYAASGKGRADLLGVLLRDLASDLRVIAVDVDRPGQREAANLWGRSLPRDAAEGERARAAGGSNGRRAIGVPARVAITFEHGTPTAVNGVPMPPRDLLASLATLAAAQGVGLVTGADSAEAPQEVEEAPAALVLAAAYQAVTAVTPASAPSTRRSFVRGAGSPPCAPRSIRKSTPGACR
jgi:argininosuccinate synthase